MTMTMPAPSRTQAFAALARANEIRLANANFIRRLRALPSDEGRELVARLLEDPDLELEHGAAIHALSLGRLIGSIRSIGPSKTGSLLWRAGVATRDRKVRALTNRERNAVALELRTGRR